MVTVPSTVIVSEVASVEVADKVVDEVAVRMRVEAIDVASPALMGATAVPRRCLMLMPHSGHGGG